METEQYKNRVQSGGKCPKMTQICSHGNVSWGIGKRPNFAWIIYAGRPSSWRKTEKVGRVLFEQIRPERVVQTGSSFGSRGHPKTLRMVPLNRRLNFLHFLFPRPCAYLASFWSYGEKNEISENESWLPWQRPLKIRNSRFRSFIYSRSGTEMWKPCENPSIYIEVEIIGLTEIVKKEIVRYRSKTYGYPVA